jgi:ribose transport system ATP-binding protein
MSEIKLKVQNLIKKYPGTIAVQDVSLEFKSGVVHALLGKNGAGKSTLVNMISGVIQPSSGKIIISGKETTLESPSDAFAKGISMVHQELSLVPELSVAENIFLGRVPRKNIFGTDFIIDWKKAHKNAGQLLKDLNISLDVKKAVGSYGVAQQQVIEIAKAMSFNPSVLILDEPTSALAHKEAHEIFELIRRLKKKNVAIIYISHRFPDLEAVADELTVLRDGKFIGTLQKEEAHVERLIQMMFGDNVVKGKPDFSSVDEKAPPPLKVKHLSARGKYEDISFELKRGEVLGIAGMVGSGRTELVRGIFGADPFDSGEIIFNGQPIINPSPKEMRNRGLAMTPESRKEQALVLAMSIKDNFSLATLNKMSKRGLLWPGKQLKTIMPTVERLKTRIPDIEEPVTTLSGGNQQKVVIGNWLLTNPKVILFDEPSRGIDVQTKQMVFEIIKELAKEGVSSIFVSSEMEELFEVCHRILVIRHGKLVNEYQSNKIKVSELMDICGEE